MGCSMPCIGIFGTHTAGAGRKLPLFAGMPSCSLPSGGPGRHLIGGDAACTSTCLCLCRLWGRGMHAVS